MADRLHGLTRRRLLRRGAGAAGAATLGAAGLTAARPGTARAQGPSGRERPNVLLIVVDGARTDFVSAYDDPDDRANTPNLDELADKALRFDRAVPDAMPAFPARRAILTGMRAYPFRDWRPTEGLAQYPGWHPIWNHQPLMTEVLEQGGVNTVYISDNPLLEARRFRGVARRPAGRAPAVTQMQRYLAPVVPGGVEDSEPPAARVVRSGIEALGELRRREPFFLGVDAFDRAEASQPTPVYARPSVLEQEEGRGAAARVADASRTGSRPVEEVARDAPADERVRDHYAAELNAVDREIGRLLDRLDDLGLAERTVVYFVSATTLSLGEHGVFGTAPAAGHEDVYRTAYMIRDPEERRAGETSRFHASTPDVAPTILAYMGLTAPGKMQGEDLTALLDEEDVHPRPNFAIGIDDEVVVSDGRYVLVAEARGLQKRLYDTDPDEHEDEESGEHDYEERDENKDISREEVEKVKVLWQVALTAAGGTMPEFSPEGPIRPAPEIEDEDDDDDDSILSRDDDLNFMDR